MTAPTPLPRIEAHLLRELQVTRARHGGRMLAFALLYVVSVTLVCLWANRGIYGWTVLAMLPCYLLAAASLHGISLFTHEAVHGTLSPSRWLNAVGGALCALPVLQNFSAYRVLHLRHHDHLGEEGDPDHYPNYTRWSWLVFLMNWGRLLVGYPAYITAIPVLGFREGNLRQRWSVALEVALAGLFLFGLSRLPWLVFLNAWLIPMLFINTFVNIRGMSQHTLLEEFHGDDVRGTRTILTNRVVTFFMCNENYHLEHHLYPGVPWYNLPRIHQLLRAELTVRGAPFIPSYFAFVREFVAGSFRRSPWGIRGEAEKP